MTNLIFVTGDYCSGSTLISTLFRSDLRVTIGVLRL
jgi:hypothetical protein